MASHGHNVFDATVFRIARWKGSVKASYDLVGGVHLVQNEIGSVGDRTSDVDIL
jgi:hypothetical protein